MTPQAFIAKWGPGGPASSLNEEQGAQSHFLDLCELLGVPKPGSEAGYLFEQGGRVDGQARGYADAFKRGAFAWENKAPGKNLDAALRQLQGYSLALDNPPLLVVCDRLNIRIHTQFNGHPSERHDIALADLERHEQRELLKRVWTEPESFRPRTTNRDITEAAARSFATLAERLRARGNSPDAVAHFLTQCLFCCFAEDVGLLPGQLFERLINAKTMSPQRLGENLGKLFEAMKSGGLFGVEDVPWFNGGLFQTSAVPVLDILDVTELRNAAEKRWNAIDVSIFGTLFERGLDPAKRSQLGAHYTDPATIERIIDPVLRRPLLREWAGTREAIGALMKKSKKRGDKAGRDALALHIGFLQRLAAFRVLDPACGSGNFLYLALKCLKDVEHLANTEAEALGLERQVELFTGPANVLGIELNEYAAELARVTVWIGELQWRLDHGYPFKTNPVLEPLDHIECRDALLSLAADGQPLEAPWPRADAVVGNPPFLGGSKKRGELGSDYFDALGQVFGGRVPGGADLVCYWFDKARRQIEVSELQAAGLVSTQSIRAGSNRAVLTAISQSMQIFDAWADEAWVNDGAAVRVSLVCFGTGVQSPSLNGLGVSAINADLSEGGSMDLTLAKSLAANSSSAFKGAEKTGAFDIDGDTARKWLREPNPNGRPNSDVLQPWRNGSDIAARTVDHWVIDFGTDTKVEAAALYVAPFSQVVELVKPEREKNNDRGRRENWWRFGRNGADMRGGVGGLNRFIVTPRVAKHRYFVWLPMPVSPDSRLFVIARSDDATFGILQSRIHELWSLAQASMHGVGNDPTYNAKSCFETFPFPEGLTPADTAHQQTETLPSGALIPAQLGNNEKLQAVASRIAEAARTLNQRREAWLNPPEWTQRVPEVTPLGMDHSPYPDRILPREGLSEADAKALHKRTLTNLYNARPAWLAMAHTELDAAVAAAYGWADYTPAMSDDEVLSRLLALNLARTASAAGAAPGASVNRRPGGAG
jgi:hypothetical protein